MKKTTNINSQDVIDAKKLSIPFVISVKNISDSELKDIEILNPSRFTSSPSNAAYINGSLFFENYVLCSNTSTLSYKEISNRILISRIEIKSVYLHTSIPCKNGEGLIYSYCDIFDKVTTMRWEIIQDPQQFSENIFLLNEKFELSSQSILKLRSLSPNCKIILYFYPIIDYNKTLNPEI